ncbi:MAG: DUF2474 domain-containing protein [Gammaproteobacteria bacterium]|jgi:hypothetical protein
MPVTSTEIGNSRSPGPGSIWRRLGWFALLWAGSLGIWLLIAYGLRGLLLPS